MSDDEEAESQIIELKMETLYTEENVDPASRKGSTVEDSPPMVEQKEKEKKAESRESEPPKKEPKKEPVINRVSVQSEEKEEQPKKSKAEYQPKRSTVAELNNELPRSFKIITVIAFSLTVIMILINAVSSASAWYINSQIETTTITSGRQYISRIDNEEYLYKLSTVNTQKDSKYDTDQVTTTNMSWSNAKLYNLRDLTRGVFGLVITFLLAAAALAITLLHTLAGSSSHNLREAIAIRHSVLASQILAIICFLLSFTAFLIYFGHPRAYRSDLLDMNALCSSGPCETFSSSDISQATINTVLKNQWGPADGWILNLACVFISGILMALTSPLLLSKFTGMSRQSMFLP